LCLQLLDLYILLFFHHILLLLDPCQDFNERMDRLLIIILKVILDLIPAILDSSARARILLALME